VHSSDKILRLKTVLDRTGLSRSTIYRKMADGTFPAQLKISINGAGWHRSAIDRWIADPAGYRADNDNPPAPDGDRGGR
jgi:prophage regulatory protein